MKPDLDMREALGKDKAGMIRELSMYLPGTEIDQPSQGGSQVYHWGDRIEGQHREVILFLHSRLELSFQSFTSTHLGAQAQ